MSSTERESCSADAAAWDTSAAAWRDDAVRESLPMRERLEDAVMAPAASASCVIRPPISLIQARRRWSKLMARPLTSACRRSAASRSSRLFSSVTRSLLRFTASRSTAKARFMSPISS